ncbi:hypothetical protein LX16_1476 [Stackebrandtia albiflava]|uniref:Butirosin biosynthesis protein H-like n=1 Tax=Stackebrandtia albiflava TaxID=406432 RepID=A0A562VD17_9ACTN|nr:hypothetical protein [Stackebrandtia albiflava]TWJ15762.1 hypothetical protein LX16_1476 [Stackebrandtia albiflava]
MSTPAYIGSGPYCYANSAAMMLDDPAVPPGLIEVLTGSPFGAQAIGPDLFFFDPPGWDPGIGLAAATASLGWECDTAAAPDAGAAEAVLRRATHEDPLLVGPVEMGLLGYHPDMTGPIGADHFLVAYAVEGDTVRLHDPHGFPHAAIPLERLLAAWRAEHVGYGEPYTWRGGFRRVARVDPVSAVRRSLPAARAWSTGQNGADAPTSRAAVERLAERCETGLPPALTGTLGHFAVRVGARRLTDAAYWLGEIGLAEVAAVLSGQAALLGAFQWDVVAGDHAAGAARLRRLAPGYDRLAELLSTFSDPT